MLSQTDLKEYKRRRRHLMQDIGKDGIAILPTSDIAIRNRDVEFPFRPDSDFLYLTGFWEPEAVLVLTPGRELGEYILFCRERDPEKEIWNGRRAGQDGAIANYGADDSFPFSDIDEILPGLLENRNRVYYTMGVHREFDQRLLNWVNQLRQKSRAGIHTPGEFVALDHLINEMRLYKSPYEIKLMQKAADITCNAHIRAMRFSQPEKYEYQLEAEIVHEFKLNGCRDSAYPSIVGCGENGTILHYTDNTDVLIDGSLVLIDAGAEYKGYAADVTRTFPVNGRFSQEQRELYEVVLEAQAAAIAKVKPGNHWNDPHEEAVKVLTRGLIRLGLLKGKLDKLIKEQAYKPFYMHRTGHWLGMDVHDVGDYKVDDAWRMLEPGMVLTIEPGLYISPSTKVAKKWWNIGIRIEDDVLVTKDGCQILTHGVPKSVAAIEAIMAGRDWNPSNEMVPQKKPLKSRTAKSTKNSGGKSSQKKQAKKVARKSTLKNQK